MSAKVIVAQRYPRLVRSVGGVRQMWRQIGEQTRFYLQALGNIPDAIINYRAELLRQVASTSLGAGALAVVGGTGSVGRPLVEALRRAGHAAVVVSRTTGADVLTGTGVDAPVTDRRSPRCFAPPQRPTPSGMTIAL